MTTYTSISKGRMVVYAVAFLWFLCPVRLQAQRLEWKADACTFMDNQEFARTLYGKKAVLSGVRLSPEIGIGWGNGEHRLMAGVHVMKEFGSHKFLDRFSFTGYYELNKTSNHRIKNRFLFGAFPRKGLLDNYSGLFFADSIHYFHPNINGFFWQMGGRNNHVNLWVDMLNMQSPTQRESFLVGLSGEQRWRWLYVDLQSYSHFYFSPVNNNATEWQFMQRLLAKAAIGIDFSHAVKHLDKMRLAVGAMGGYHRAGKGFSDVYYPIGLAVDLNAEFWYIGTRTTFYYGKPLYNAFDPITQLGNPFGYGKYYLETEWYVPIYQNEILDARASATFHVAEGKCFYQQQLHLSVSLDRDKFPAKKYFERKHRQPKVSE